MCPKHVSIASYRYLSRPHAGVVIQTVWLLSMEHSETSVINTRTPPVLETHGLILRPSPRPLSLNRSDLPGDAPFLMLFHD